MTTAITPSSSKPAQAQIPPASSISGEIIKKITMVWNGVVGLIVAVVKCIFEFVWYSSPQRAAMHEFDKKAMQTDSHVEKIYFQDLKAEVASLKRGEDPAILLANIDDTATKMEELCTGATAGVEELIARLKFRTVDELTQDADELYRVSMNTLAALKNLPITDLQKALYTGRLTTLFRKLDDAFSDEKGVSLHRYCGCHIKSKQEDHGLKNLAPGIRSPGFLVDPPQNEVRSTAPDHPTAVLLSQSYGGGHNVVQHAMSQRLAERGGHAYKIEADEEVLEPYYNYRKWTGKSGAEWSKFFLQNNYFRTIRFLGWLSSGRDSKSAREEKISHFTRSLLARGQQDVAMMCFQRNTSPAEKAASRIGMGLYEVATDLDFQVFDFEKDVENLHFKHGMMARDPEREQKVLHHALDPHQYVEIGFPVRDAFLKNYSTEELTQIRKEYLQKYNLEPDARVVILLCGGEGVSNTLAETLAKQFPEDGPKTHLFAICGKNKEKKESLDKEFATLNKANFNATALGWTNEKMLGELFAMGAHDEYRGLLISAKAGGGTISEAIARGIPTLARELSGIPHEQDNLNFLIDKKLGKEFKKENELTKNVVEMLTAPYTPSLSPDGKHYSDYNSKEKSMKVLDELIVECRDDAEFQLRKRQITAKLPPASHVEGAEKKAHYKKLWSEYGWNKVVDFNQLMESHPDFLTFLRESKILYAIRGFQHTFQKAGSNFAEAEPFKTAIQIDEKGHPLIYKEGKWVRWETIKEEIEYVKERKLVASRNDATVEWNYLYPNGLVPQSNKGHIAPFYQLNPEELKSLKASCGATEECNHIIQVVTTENKTLKRISHVGLRLITEDGKVYSISYEISDEAIKFNDHSKYLATYNAGISSLDYTELDPFIRRRVTSKPVSAENFDRAMDKIKEYSQTDLRFNFIHQNCCKFVSTILNEANISIDTTSSAAPLVWDIAKDLPVLGVIVQTIDLVAKAIFKCLDYIIPYFIQIPIIFTVKVATYIPLKILSIIKNLLLLSFGAGKIGTAPKSDAQNNWDNRKGLTAFHRYINNWTDIFKDDMRITDSSIEMVNWQLGPQKKQTHIFEYDGSPSFAIVPPQAATAG